MARTYTFKGSTDGWGYSAWIEDDMLVICESWPHEGGVIFRGDYKDATPYLNEMCRRDPNSGKKLCNAIKAYYSEAEEAKHAVTNKAVAKKATESGITHRFKDSRDSRGNGYSGYIKNGKLFLEYDDPRNGGAYFNGSYEDAKALGYLERLMCDDIVLYNEIEKYFIKHGVKDEIEDLNKKYYFDEETKTVLFKVKLYMDDGHTIHSVMVRGRSQSGVITKLFPAIPEVLTLQTYRGEVFAVRSNKISAAEFVED
jgi:hypothetical protein